MNCNGFAYILFLCKILLVCYTVYLRCHVQLCEQISQAETHNLRKK